MNSMILLVLIERELSEGKSCYVPDTALNGLVQALELSVIKDGSGFICN